MQYAMHLCVSGICRSSELTWWGCSWAGRSSAPGWLPPWPIRGVLSINKQYWLVRGEFRTWQACPCWGRQCQGCARKRHCIQGHPRLSRLCLAAPHHCSLHWRKKRSREMQKNTFLAAVSWSLTGPELELDNIRMLPEDRKFRVDKGAAVGRNVDFFSTFFFPINVVSHYQNSWKNVLKLTSLNPKFQVPTHEAVN